MKNKIPIVGFIIAILLLAPISAISKETMITDTLNQYNHKIKLSFEEMNTLISAIINIKNTEVIAVGDSIVDIGMIKKACLVIAYKAPEYVQKNADIITDELNIILEYV